MSQPQTLPVFFTLEEVAQVLKVKKRTVERAVASGRLEAVRIGRYLRVTDTAVRKFAADKGAV